MPGSAGASEPASASVFESGAASVAVPLSGRPPVSPFRHAPASATSATIGMHARTTRLVISPDYLDQRTRSASCAIIMVTPFAWSQVGKSQTEEERAGGRHRARRPVRAVRDGGIADQAMIRQREADGQVDAVVLAERSPRVVVARGTAHVVRETEGRAVRNAGAFDCVADGAASSAVASLAAYGPGFALLAADLRQRVGAPHRATEDA